jgi:glycerol-3-phosphate O-acyltransferase/dihydroxyacetone phosphate acyltransferase
MIYPSLKIIMKTAVRIFFKKISITGLENIPKDKPLLFAANHVNAFMDAIVVAVFIQQELYFLTRSDVFNTPLKKWILKKMNLLPIYRLQEGADNLHKNEQVFIECYQLLDKKESILIFSEGICIQEKRLQKLKKGTARIAFGAEQFKNFELDLEVVPVGINYNKPSQFRSNLNLNFGAPLQVKNYAALYKTDENKATYQFTRDLEQRMIEQMLHLKNKSNDMFFEHIAEIASNELALASRKIPATKKVDYKIHIQVAHVVNTIGPELDEKMLVFKNDLSDYFKKLKKAKLKDKFVKSAPSSGFLISLKLLFALVGLPLHLVSLIFNYLPYKLPSIIANKVCKHIEFVSSVIIGTAAFLFLLFFIGWGYFLASYTTSLGLKVLCFFIAPILGIYSLYYYGFIKNLSYQIKLYFSPQLKNVMLKERLKILTQFEHLIFDKIKIQND